MLIWPSKNKSGSKRRWIRIIIYCSAILLIVSQTLAIVWQTGQNFTISFIVLGGTILFYAAYSKMTQAIKRNDASKQRLTEHLSASRGKVDKLENTINRLDQS